MGGGDPPGAVPVVDDPVPVVAPVDVAPVDVLDDEVGWVVALELSGVVGVEDPAVAPDSVDGVPVEVEVEVEVEVDVEVRVVVDPAVAPVLLPSEGAVGLTPPLPGVVEMPPVARTLILTGVVVVVESEVGVAAGLVDALAESPVATPAGV
ncbi:MAG TPA: hypothetical protein VFH80_28295 [Solirubrobacteraceae bacterium]|nr:hypothetical protein [Solirubrobacteraceae bacterium]